MSGAEPVLGAFGTWHAMAIVATGQQYGVYCVESRIEVGVQAECVLQYRPGKAVAPTQQARAARAHPSAMLGPDMVEDLASLGVGLNYAREEEGLSQNPDGDEEAEAGRAEQPMSQYNMHRGLMLKYKAGSAASAHSGPGPG
ncbi:uncharacterized protein BDZ83DRAFT_653095 [Colletotrichum acutatum]|uniref:Uncharacterized protein n=1 Tax=Glomerella acutata TaxID=27357 RepID=A0AAD8ULU3_GLOAC|nr:uncharacterized protein BDZ83DRAFT_653095 [Colletotrichum acutatum]KAK1723444.1 hypothetical protein BDZ83DRAFT_653095 [Colletotrichum acutatum]